MDVHDSSAAYTALPSDRTQAVLSLSAENSFLQRYTGACPHTLQYPVSRASID
jgi:hypothetical protein